MDVKDKLVTLEELGEAIAQSTAIQTSTTTYASQIGGFSYNFYKQGNVVYVTGSVQTSATSATGTNYTILGTIPSGFAPKGTALGLIDRNDTGHQGYGIIHIGSGKFTYMPFIAGLSGVALRLSATYITD